MILNEKTYKLESNGEFQEQNFTISPEFINKAIWMLINQYRYKVRTPVQEIISNARDAQRENGNPDTPIKIVLPTRLESTFKVRDYGVGISPERVDKVLRNVGASTKNVDNIQTGGFGIGFKAPLTYTDQFNFKTFINGKYWLYVVAKTQEGGISIVLIGEGETDEPNGTEVQIPVNPNDRNDFIKAACRTTMFWEVQPIFNLEGEDIYTAQNETRLNKISLYGRYDLGQLFNESLIVCVDGIPYPIDYDTRHKVKTLAEIRNMVRGTAVIHLNVGDIDLLQTRENIDETEKTLSQLRKVGLEALTSINEYLTSCYTAKDLEGRISQHKNLCSKFSGIKSHKFAQVFSVGESALGLSEKFKYYGYAFKGRWGARTKKAQKKDKNYWGQAIGYNELNNVYWDDLKDSESSNMKARRLRYQLEQSGASEIRVIEKHNASNFEWVRTIRMVGIKKLSSLPLPPKAVRVKGTVKKKNKKPEIITVHKVYNGGGKVAQDIDYPNNSTKFVYVDYQDSFSGWQRVLNDYTDYTPVKLSKTVQKTVKDDKNFISFEAFKLNFEPSERLLKASLAHFSESLSLKGKKMRGLRYAKPYIFDKILLKAIDLCNTIDSEWASGYWELPREVKDILDKKLESKKLSVASRFDRLHARIERYPLLEKTGNFEQYTWGESRLRRQKKDQITEGRKMAQYINTIYLAQTRRRL